MQVELSRIDDELRSLLKPEQFKDYCPNGLQVQGRPEVKKLVTGVTASMALLEAALEANADAVLVHHGYFWQGENQCVVGAKQRRLKYLLENEMSLFAYHLPLDVHSELGNNAQLAKLLGFVVEGDLRKQNNHPLVFSGRLSQSLSIHELGDLLNQKLGREPQIVEGSSRQVSTIAWCTGAAQSYIDDAINAGVDAYLTGEVSEQTVHAARESGMHFISAGHHATERYGVQAVGAYLADRFTIKHEYIEVPNPV